MANRQSGLLLLLDRFEAERAAAHASQELHDATLAIEASAARARESERRIKARRGAGR